MSNRDGKKAKLGKKAWRAGALCPKCKKNKMEVCECKGCKKRFKYNVVCKKCGNCNF